MTMSNTTYKAAIFDLDPAATEVTLDDLRDLPERRTSDGIDPQHDNDASATRAAGALVAYTDRCGDPGDMETRIADLLADLRHLCDALGVDYQEMDDTGRRRHAEEIRGVR